VSFTAVIIAPTEHGIYDLCIIATDECGLDSSEKCVEFTVTKVCTDGADGADGAVGPTGATGRAGAAGSVGPVGPVGPKGANGVNGIDGTDGIDGADGIDGIDGAPGIHGIHGTHGTHGKRGVDGIHGKHGIHGAAGSLLTSGSVLKDLSMNNFLKVGRTVQGIESGSISTKDLRFKPTSEANVEARKGNIYFDNSSNKLRQYNGTEWKETIGGSMGPTGADGVAYTGGDFEITGTLYAPYISTIKVEIKGKLSVEGQLTNNNMLQVNGQTDLKYLTLSVGSKPVGPSAGTMYFNRVDNSLYLYNGTAWNKFKMKL
jgi:hypothetical protein